MLRTDIRQDDRGVDRCNRTATTAVPNVMGDPGKGYHNVQAICGMPIVRRISDGVTACPRCDREPPVGNVHPRTINSAGITLSAQELKECGVTEDTSKIEQPVLAIKEAGNIVLAVEAKMSEIKKDAVGIEVSLDLLEQCDDIPALFIQAAIESMDNLPVTNFKESKRLIKLQEKLEALLKV